MRNSILWLFLFILCFSANLSALDKKVEVGSEKMKSNQTIMEFASRYTAAINTKNIEALVDLMSPASLKCYKESKHPEYYQEEFKKWFKADIKSLMEIRKYTTYDHKFHELMNYPELPTHVAVFGGVKNLV